MSSQVQICNLALIAAGQETIAKMTDQSKQAKHCNILWDMVLDAELARHTWSFAKKRAVLAPDTSVVPFGFTYKLPFLADHLRLLWVEEVEHAREGDGLLCDQNSLQILYVARKLDPSTFPPFFVEVMAAALAPRLNYVLEGKVTRTRELKIDYQTLLRDARFVNATEQPLSEVEASAWEESRA